jgi:hypothetical protein
MKKITTFIFGIFCMLSVANAQNVMLFDFDIVNADHPFFEVWNGTWPNTAFAKVANPDASGINTSANVGEFIANGGANGELFSDTLNNVSQVVSQFDFTATPYFSLKVWVGKPVTVSVEFRNHGYYPSFVTKTQSVTTINQWVIVEFNCSDISFGAPGNYWGTYDRIGVLFDKDLSGGTKANDVYYFDDIQRTATSLLTATGLPAETSAKFSVYPNPATDYILTQNAQKVTILDLNGRIVKEAYNTEKVDVSSLANGTYIVKAQTGNETKIGKLIKE